jgi:uncharacterized RDD family membrane protein YckC
VNGNRLEQYPFPIAYSARLLSIAENSADRIEHAQNFVELTAVTLGVLALGWCQAQALCPDGVKNWERKLDPSGIALGTWISMIRSAAKAMVDRPHDPLARAIRLAATAALPALDSYTPVRNVYAHGGKPRLHPDREAAMDELRPGISAILDGIAPLTQIRLGRIMSCEARGASYQTDVDVLAGPSEPFPSRSLRSSVPLDEASVFAYHETSLSFAVDLTPYCMWQRCPACQRHELFYLHQRKKGKDRYFSFSTGHELISSGTTARPAAKPSAALGMPPLGSARASAASGWRANWANLVSRPRRITARVIDIALAAITAFAGYSISRAAGASVLISAAAVAVPLALLYEPLTALTGGTPGKRITRIEAVSVWDSRKLGRPDTIRRAVAASIQILLPPLALYNLAWLLWDPARQCLHDRVAGSIVIPGRSRTESRY